jgi:hypothetical protein
MDGNDENNLHAQARVNGCRGMLKTIHQGMVEMRKGVTDDIMNRLQSGGKDVTPSDARNAEIAGAVVGAPLGVIGGVVEAVAGCVASGEGRRQAVEDALKARRDAVWGTLHRHPFK